MTVLNVRFLIDKSQHLSLSHFKFYNLNLLKANNVNVEALARIFLIPIQKYTRIVDLDCNKAN